MAAVFVFQLPSQAERYLRNNLNRFAISEIDKAILELMIKAIAVFLLVSVYPGSYGLAETRFEYLMSIGSFISVSHADHLASQAKGKPEKVLAGIKLGRSKIADVIKLYGKPSKVTQEPKPPNLNVVDTYHYYWIKGSTKLHLLVEGGYMALIEVQGPPSSDQIVRTGRGLKIGDDLADVRRIYGTRYKVRNIPNLKIHDVEIQWHAEEYSLVADLDARGRIKTLSLFAPE